MEKIAFVCFLICSLINLTFAFFEMEKYRKITKGFVLLSLIVFVSFLNITNFYIYLALLSGFIGDIFMLKKKEKTFLLLGIIAFGLNHLFYMLAICRNIDILHQKFAFLIPLVYLFIAIITILIFGKLVPSYKIRGGIYASFLIFEFLMCLLFAIYECDKGYYLSILSLVGIIFFMISDAYICKTMFYRHDKREDFYIMLTYIIGQILLSLSLGMV